MRMNNRTMEQSISHVKRQAQAATPQNKKTKLKKNMHLRGNHHLSNLENVVYDQTAQIENSEIRIDSGFQQLHQLVGDRFQ